MNHLRFSIKCMAHLNNQYACEVSKLPWNMANVFFWTWNDFRFQIPLLLHPWSVSPLMKPKIQVAPKILARRAKAPLQVKFIRCYGWWINIKWNVSIINIRISQSQSVEFWIQWNSTQINDFFYCQQWFANVRFRVPPEFGSPAWDDSPLDVSLIGPTFPTSNFGSQNLLLPRVTLNFGIALVVWWKIDHFWWVFPVQRSSAHRILLGEVIRLQCFVRKIWASRGPRRWRLIVFHQRGRRRYETDGRSCPSADSDEMKWKLIDVLMWEEAEELINWDEMSNSGDDCCCHCDDCD